MKEEIHMNIQTWESFYEEFASKLLEFKDNREPLIEAIKNVYTNIDLKLPKLEKDNKVIDIDPFTVFALFNKGITKANRIKIITGFKNYFKLQSSVPNNFDGIPVLNNMHATFYSFIGNRKPDDIQNIWNLFETAIKYAEQQNNEIRNNFAKEYDIVVSQKGVSWNITMGLFWIRPAAYINLDSCMRSAFKNMELIPPVDTVIYPNIKKLPNGNQYLEIIENCKKVFEHYPDLNFVKLSHKAWEHSSDRDEKGYWPSLTIFNPEITKEMWQEALSNLQVTSIENLVMLKMMLELGGEATCAKLAEVYGKTHGYYNGLGSGYGYKVCHHFDLSPIEDDGEIRYYVFPFQGKRVQENGKSRYVWRIRAELKEALEEMDLSHIDTSSTAKETVTAIPKNTILYGPPGTGKTYNTVCYAVAIIENKSLEDIMTEASEDGGYESILGRYIEYKNQNLIEFTTFHQSYGYEEFIEGIKPITEFDDEEQTDIKYSIVDGIFKEFCNRADSPVVQNEENILGLNKNPVVWKVSMWSTGDNPIRTECMENGHIRIGWDDYGPEITSETDFSKFGGKNVLNNFIYKMNIGDVVLSCYSSTTIDAIGVVTGDYEWSGKYEDLNRMRKVNWLIKGINENILEMNGGTVFTLSSVYRAKVSVADALSIVEKYSDALPVADKKMQNRVFIIDEINRGNISKIFGELITLVEPSKRIGAKEGLKATLPYSKKPFGIPANVYILGTMNTADRSIATLDTALRRRFDFVEMMPDTDILEGILVDGIDVGTMLKKINERITILFDREHTIGHAYFIELKENHKMETLAKIFKNKVIPLLQEYFYEDYDRIRLVLADNQVSEKDLQFIIAENVDAASLFGSNDIDFLDDSKCFKINNTAFENKDAYIKIYNI